MVQAIALDTSSKQTGYVRGATDGSAPLVISSFSVDPKWKGDIGRQMHDFREKLAPRLTGVEVVFLERPVLPFGKLNYDTLRILYGIAGMVEVMAIDRGIPCFDVQNGKHKKLIYGKGGTKPENPVELAGAWGMQCQNGDEADACGVWLYAIQKLFPDDFGHWSNIKTNSPIITGIYKPKKKNKSMGRKVAKTRTLI